MDLESDKSNTVSTVATGSKEGRGASGSSSEDYVHVDNATTAKVSYSEEESVVDGERRGEEGNEALSVSGGGGGVGESERRELPNELVGKVMKLTYKSKGEGGVCDVYLVGTAHVSSESCQDVEAVITFLKPQFSSAEVGPKKILDLIGVPWLTRENVASHLQKYRLYLSRLQKEKESTAFFGGMKHSDVSSKEHTGNHCLQNLVNMQQTKGSCDISGNKTIMQQNIDFKSNEADMKCIVTMPIVEPKNALNGDNPDSQKGSISRMAPNHSFKQLDSDIKYAVTIPKQYTWDAEGLST